MKIQLLLLIATALLPLAPISLAEEKQDHKDPKHEEKSGPDQDIKPPNGGKILHELTPHAELFITKENKVQITFMNDEGKALATEATITAIGGKRNKPTKFTFEKSKEAYLSKETLPSGKLVPLVLTVKPAEGEKKRIRLNLNLSDCSACKFKEYACSCDGDHDKKNRKGKDDKQ